MKKKLIKFDWALKKILRNKVNFDILEGFLSELLKEDIKIQKIFESESNKGTSKDKFNRVDLLAENSKKELIIIDVQSETEEDFFQRILYGTSKLLKKNMQEEMFYSEVSKIISVSIVYFDLGQGDDYIYVSKTNFLGLNKKDTLQLNENQRMFYNRSKLEYYVLNVNQFGDEIKNKLDEWIYFLKNEEIKDTFSAKGLERAKETFDITQMSKEEQEKYENYFEDMNQV